MEPVFIIAVTVPALVAAGILAYGYRRIGKGSAPSPMGHVAEGIFVCAAYSRKAGGGTYTQITFEGCRSLLLSGHITVRFRPGTRIRIFKLKGGHYRVEMVDPHGMR